MYKKSSWRLQLSTIAVLLLFTSVSVVRADQGFYAIDKTIRTGMLVSLSENPEVIKPSSQENSSSMVGIVGEGSASLESNPEQINVRTEGVANALVSTINGDIKVGDSITASPLVGLGSKLKGNGWIVGIAQASLDASTSGAVKSNITDTDGNKHEVYVASIPVLIKIMYFNSNTEVSNEISASVIPKSLQSTLDSVAGRRASQTAVFLSFLLLLAGFIISGLIAYAAVRSAIQTTGRQPLAKKAIMQRMIQSCIVALTILLAAIISAGIVIRVL